MLSALSRHSQAIATLRCSFPEADIGNGAQHFGGADDCNADKVSFRCGCTKVRFGEALNRLSFSFGCLGATKLAKQKCNIDHNLAGAHPSIQLYVKSVLNVLVAVQCAKAECDRADRESLINGVAVCFCRRGAVVFRAEGLQPTAGSPFC